MSTRKTGLLRVKARKSPRVVKRKPPRIQAKRGAKAAARKLLMKF